MDQQLLNEELTTSVINDDLERMRFWAERGADVNYMYSGRPLLHLTVERRHFAGLKYLVENVGADIHKPDNNQHVALHWTISNNDQDMFKYLVDQGCDINVRGANEHTLLHHACLWKRPRFVELLLNSGLDLNAINKFGKTPFDIANGECLAAIENHIISQKISVDNRVAAEIKF